MAFNQIFLWIVPILEFSSSRGNAGQLEVDGRLDPLDEVHQRVKSGVSRKACDKRFLSASRSSCRQDELQSISLPYSGGSAGDPENPAKPPAWAAIPPSACGSTKGRSSLSIFHRAPSS